MEYSISEFAQQIQGKAVDVIGIGISNQPLIKYLARAGAVVTARDRRTKEEIGPVYEELKSMGVRFSLGPDYLKALDGALIFKTPGMRFDVPELEEARARGATITSEMEVFFDVCPSHIIGVTGSDGKTTTTTLIHKMMTLQGYHTWVGGNIGTPLLTQADQMKPDDWVILELSSFQLHTMGKSPEIAVVTNISPNHLDMHKDYQEYIDAKKNLYLYQAPKDRLVLNWDNAVTREMGVDRPCLYFSRTDTDCGVYLKEDTIYYQGTPVLDSRDIKIPGMHNVENYMAAIGAVGELVDPAVIREVARTFGGVEHRIELVRTLDGVRYYNSSIDSSPNRTINTLRVFPERVILIAGGKDKGIAYDELGPALTEHVKTLVLIGATAGKIETALRQEQEKTGAGQDICVISAKTYEEAVRQASAAAQLGDVVILSPASTSFDRFKNFEERGNLFKKLVNELS